MLPKLNELNTSRDMITAFYGYNHRDRISESEFYDMKNLSSDQFPCIAPRKRRGKYRTTVGSPSGMIAKDDAFCYVDGSQVIVHNPRPELKDLEFDFIDNSDETPRQLVSMGAYVIILPDKKYINTAKSDDYGNIDYTVNITTQTRVNLCQKDGTDIANETSGGSTGGEVDVNEISVSAIPPRDPEDGTYWIDTSITDSHMLKRWSSVSSAWVPITSTYVKISAKNIANNISVGDGVTISGFENSLESLNGIKTIASVYRDKGSVDEEGKVIAETVGKNDYIVIKGSVTYTSIYLGEINISRKMPDMDFVCEAGNRLWGCKFGKNADGQFVNEIYASKLGDFKNWNVFEGLSTDSYAASCGSDGAFTGAVSYNGRPIFFKENNMHLVYGSFPSEFQIVDTKCRGVQEGCHKSLATVNEILYYKSRTGVMRYDGSLPVEVSSNLGDVSYDNAVACGHKNKYYISMRNVSDKTYSFFAYDTSRDMWHKEDSLNAVWLCSVRDEIYYVDAEATTEIRTLFATNENYREEQIEWEAVTGLIGLSHPDHKYISRVTVRLSLDYGTHIEFYIQYDNDDRWYFVHEMYFDYKKNPRESKRETYSVPLRTRRCDHFRLKIVGSGDAQIYSISKTIEHGTDLR